MTRKATSITILTPRAAESVANKFAPADSLETLPFWDELKPRERELLSEEATALSAARIIHGLSGMAIGEHLSRISKLLEGYPNAFERYLKSIYLPVRSGYRYKAIYEEASTMFSPAVMIAAMARGMTLPGKYAEAITMLPPPHRITDDKAVAYLDQVEEKRREITAGRKDGSIKPPKAPAEDSVEGVRRDPTFLKMQTYRMAKNGLRVMSSKQKRRFIESLTGMLLTEIGVSNPMTFAPEAIPEAFRQGRGRPRNVERMAASA